MMSTWHTQWQELFPRERREVTFDQLPGKSKKARRADVLVSDTTVVEFQHSRISSNEIQARISDYSLHDKQVVWVIDGTFGITVTLLETTGCYLIEFGSDNWRYNNFRTAGCTVVYLHAGNHVYRLPLAEVRCDMMDVRDRHDLNSFVNWLSTGVVDVARDNEVVDRMDMDVHVDVDVDADVDVDVHFFDSTRNHGFWDVRPLPQCTLYHKQRGAGVGKTYESVQLAARYNAACDNKTEYIYVTKMNSAKEVIMCEWREQYDRGDIHFYEFEETDAATRKHYRIRFQKTPDSPICTVTIGTIDSFMCSLGDKRARGVDFFAARVDSVAQHPSRVSSSGGMLFGGNFVELNKHAIIIVDEAQDLPVNYLQALVRLMRDTYIDVVTIGDLLQSTTEATNIYTFFRDGGTVPNTHIVRDVGENCMKRFTSPQLRDFVNLMVPFESFGLPPITLPVSSLGVAATTDTLDLHSHAVADVTLVEIRPIWYSAEIDIANDRIIKQITQIMRQEVDLHDYAPRDFMIIFPCVSKNLLAVRLEEELETFWAVERGLAGDDDTKHVFLHQSQEHQPIQLAESEHATRILSIHASKGSGRPVVLLFDTRDAVFKLFHTEPGELKFESLLHVALTRQKKKLFIGLTPNPHDSVYRRVRDAVVRVGGAVIYDTEHEFSSAVRFSEREFKNCKMSRVVDYVMTTDARFNMLDDTCGVTRVITGSDPENNGQPSGLSARKVTVDQGHHVARYVIMKSIMNISIYNYACRYKSDDPAFCDAVRYRLKDFVKCRAVTVPSREYWPAVNEMWVSLKRKPKVPRIDEIPVVFPAHGNVGSPTARRVESMLTRLRSKLKPVIEFNDLQPLPLLCPLEMILLIHAEAVRNSHMYASLSISTVFRIIECYKDAFQRVSVDHGPYGCLCPQYFGASPVDTLIHDATSDVFKQTIVHHHETLSKVTSMFERIMTMVGTGVMKFVHEKIIKYEGGSDLFELKAEADFVGRNETDVVHIVVRPQFNLMNNKTIVVDAMFTRFMLMNTPDKNENDEVYKGKRMHTFIVTLDHDHPIVLDLGGIHSRQPIMLEFIHEKMFRAFSSFHPSIFAAYGECSQAGARRPPGMSAIMFTRDYLFRPGEVHRNYVFEFLTRLHDRMVRETAAARDLILKHKDAFVHEMDTFLREQLDLYLGIGLVDYDF